MPAQPPAATRPQTAGKTGHHRAAQQQQRHVPPAPPSGRAAPAAPAAPAALLPAGWREGEGGRRGIEVSNPGSLHNCNADGLGSCLMQQHSMHPADRPSSRRTDNRPARLFLPCLEQVLQVQQDLLALVLVDEGGGNARLALTAWRWARRQVRRAQVSGSGSQQNLPQCLARHG